jgi:hypothetical protein
VDAHAALGDVLLARGVAPETVELDEAAFMRLRARGDTRPASDAQIRRVFGLGYSVGLVRDQIVALVERVAGTDDVDALTREQVQDVFDALDRAA